VHQLAETTNFGGNYQPLLPATPPTLSVES